MQTTTSSSIQLRFSAAALMVLLFGHIAGADVGYMGFVDDCHLSHWEKSGSKARERVRAHR